MRKKVVFTLLTIFLVLSFYGCSKKKTEKKIVVTEENATFFTYDYIVSLVGNKVFPKMTYIYPVEKYVIVFEYKNLLTDESGLITVADEEVDAIVNSRKKSYATREVKTEGKVSKDDILVVDITGTIDGNPIEGALIDYEYKLGGNMIDELDERLVGVKVGDSFDMPGTFSNDYEDKTYAGREVIFNIKINGIVNYIYPEENEEFYNKMALDFGESGAYSDEAGLKTYLKDTLYKSKLSSYKEQYYNDSWNKVLENTVVKKTPDYDYESAYNQMYNTFETMYENSDKQYGDVNDYLASIGYTKKIYELSDEAANYYVKEKLATLYIAMKEGITVSKDEYESCVDEFIKSIPDANYESADEFINSIGDAKYLFMTERYYEVLYKKVRQFVTGE